MFWGSVGAFRAYGCVFGSSLLYHNKRQSGAVGY